MKNLDFSIQLIISALLTIVVLGGPFLLKFFLKRFEKHFEHQGRYGLAITFSVLSKEYYFLMILLLSTILVRTFPFPPDYKGVLDIIVDSFFWIVIGRILFRWVEVPIVSLKKSAAEQKTSLNLMVIPFVRTGLRFLIISIVVLEIVQTISNKSISSILAGLGIGGVALALASQNALSHLVGSLVIFIDRPFQLGERIVVDQWDGTVEKVGMRSTRIRTGDDEIITIPNGELANKSIKNAGRRSFIKKVIRIELARQNSSEKLIQALDILKNLLTQQPYSNVNYPPRVFIEKMGEYSLDILINYWFFNTDNWKFMEYNDKLYQSILKAFAENKIDLAIPSRTVYMVQEGARTLEGSTNMVLTKEKV